MLIRSYINRGNISNINKIFLDLSKMSGRSGGVTAAEEVAAVVTIRRTPPVAKEAVVEVTGLDQQRSDLTKS